jgi:hypothetical protein
MRIATIATAVSLCATSAHAQSQCHPTPAIYEALVNAYGETRVMAGLQADGVLLEVWANRELGTWTMFFTLPNGQSCILTAGENFAEYRPEPNL